MLERDNSWIQSTLKEEEQVLLLHMDVIWSDDVFFQPWLTGYRKAQMRHFWEIFWTSALFFLKSYIWKCSAADCACTIWSILVSGDVYRDKTLSTKQLLPYKIEGLGLQSKIEDTMRLQFLNIALISSSPLLSLLFSYYGIVLFWLCWHSCMWTRFGDTFVFKNKPRDTCVLMFCGIFCGVLSG